MSTNSERNQHRPEVESAIEKGTPTNTTEQRVASGKSEVRDKLQEILETRALELEALGWFKTNHSKHGSYLLKERQRKWSDEFRQRIIELSGWYLHEGDGYTDYVVMLEAIGVDPWPKLRDKAQRHLERGEFDEAEAIYYKSIPFDSKLMEDNEKRVMPDNQLLACGRACRTKNDFENAEKAYAHMQEAPEPAEANEIVIWLLENNRLTTAGEFAVDWEVTKYQSEFYSAARDSLESGMLMEAYKCYRAARCDMHGNPEVRIGLVNLARSELARERQETISFRADSREECLAKTWDKANEEKGYFHAHPFQLVNVIRHPEGVKRARIRREVIKELGTPDDIFELIMHEQELGFLPPKYILDLLEKVGPDHPGYRQRMLDCIYEELQTADNQLRGIGRTGPDLFSKKEEIIKNAEEILEEVQGLCEIEGINPPMFLLAKLAKLYLVVGNGNAAQALLDKYGDALTEHMKSVKVVEEPQTVYERIMRGMEGYQTDNKPRRQIPRNKFVEEIQPLSKPLPSGTKEEVLKQLKRIIPRNRLPVVIQQCKMAADVVGVDAVRAQLRRRVRKEVEVLIRQMQSEKAKSTDEDAKTRWGNDVTHRRWNEKSKAVIDTYEFLDESSISDDEQAKLGVLAVCHQQAYGDAREKNPDSRWCAANDALETARKIYKFLAELELKACPPEAVTD